MNMDIHIFLFRRKPEATALHRQQAIREINAVSGADLELLELELAQPGTSAQ
jgi:hypothetical protein